MKELLKNLLCIYMMLSTIFVLCSFGLGFLLFRNTELWWLWTIISYAGGVTVIFSEFFKK